MSNSASPLPIAESPRGTQPGGNGFFVRCEIAWGRCRRWLLRRLAPGHVRRWHAIRQGDDPVFDSDVIDSRDLKFIRPICKFGFRREDDSYARRDDYGFARWGYAELVGFTLVFLVLAAGFGTLAGTVHWLFLVPVTAVWLLILEVVWFFRDPPRRISDDPAAVVSPADGTITHIETITDPEFPTTMLRISIFLSIFNVHVNRVPRTGRVTAVRYFRGEFLDARHSDCARRNEQLWLDMTDAATGSAIRVKQISGAIARRIVCAVKPGDELKAGERFGMIKFGSRTDLLIPAELVAETKVKVGGKVSGAATVLLLLK